MNSSCRECSEQQVGGWHQTRKLSFEWFWEEFFPLSLAEQVQFWAHSDAQVWEWNPSSHLHLTKKIVNFSFFQCHNVT